MRMRWVSIVLLAAGIVALSGCGFRRCNARPAPAFYPPPPPPAQAFHAPAGPHGCNGCNAPAPQRAFYPSPAVTSPLPPAPTAVGPWQPVPGVQPHVVETRPIPLPDNGVKVLPPVEGGARLMPPVEAEPAQPPPPKERIAQPDPADFPVGIPGFKFAEDRVAVGLPPSADGFDWLKAQGYRTVVHLRAANDPGVGDRAEIERRGLRYVTLEVTPSTLNRELVREFGRLIRDPQGQPVFVYDRKGMATGTLFYLHYRLIENVPETVARPRAARLGLKDDAGGEYTELWLRINALLRGV